MRLRETRALLGLLVLTVFRSSECLETEGESVRDLAVLVSTLLPLCDMCTDSIENEKESCSSSYRLVRGEEVKLTFNCSTESYNVTVFPIIDCTQDTCSPETVDTQMNLAEFNRRFNPELKIPKNMVSQDIDWEGLKNLQWCIGLNDGSTKSKGQTQDCQNSSASQTVEPKVVVDSPSSKPTEHTFVSVDPSITVIVSQDPGGTECEVCTVDGSAQDCDLTEKWLTNVNKLEFKCPKPQEVYSVKIKKKIKCTQTSCTPQSVNASLFVNFKRSLTWDIEVPESTKLSLYFPDHGLKEILGAESCQDGYKYSVNTTKSDGSVKAKSFCRNGTVLDLELFGATNVTFEVPEQKQEPKVFSFSTTPRANRVVTVTTDPETTIIISSVSDEPDCSVCVETPNSKCSLSTTIHPSSGNTSVKFTCPQPQDVFRVEINRKNETSDSGDIVQADLSPLFRDFNRDFTWDLKVKSNQAFQLDFPKMGMQQIPNKEKCPDNHTYSVVIYGRFGLTTIGTFCKGGTVTTILARYKGRVSLEVPRDTELNPDFTFRVGPQTSMLAIVKVNLPRDVSVTKFSTPNYSYDFPNNEQMQWDFTVPGMHNYTIHFHDFTAPECLRGEVEVEYKKEDNKMTTLTLTDAQPAHQQGNFNMVLKNCETNQTLQGLTLDYSVSVMRRGHPVRCTVDLTTRGVSLQIEKVGSDPYCEMSIDSKVEKKINVAAGTKASLSFLDCPNEDVRLTASEVIGCQNVSSCPPISLSVPKLDSCLPMPLHSFTWHLDVPQSGTVNLVLPTGSFQQSLPGQMCNQPVLNVTERDGFSLGDFCFNGNIQKIQASNNISVTAVVHNINKISELLLNVSYSPEIPETFIYKVSPKATSPTLLATPNWPQGMKPLSIMSWIVTLPSQYQAHLQFVNVSQPQCNKGTAAITMKMLGNEEEIMSCREDEKLEENHVVTKSFYLNMSNCQPEKGHFGVVTRIVLEKKTNLMVILLGLTGAILLVLIVLIVVCVVKKKKKKERMNKESSIYTVKGNIFRQGDKHFTKSPSDESQVYSTIDDTMLYGHLLGNTSYADSMQDNFNGMQVDSYRTFTGPNDAQLPIIKEPDPEPKTDQYKTFLDPSESFIPPRPRTPIDRQDSLGFQDRRMVDNELYTFRGIGEINTIRLSGVDLEPEPPILEESL